MGILFGLSRKVDESKEGEKRSSLGCSFIWLMLRRKERLSSFVEKARSEFGVVQPEAHLFVLPFA